MTSAGSRLRALRLSLGLSQGDVERRCGHTILRSTISRIEHGHLNPRLETLARIVNACGLTLTQFFADAPPGSALSPADRAFLLKVHKLTAGFSPKEKRLVVQLAKHFAREVPS